MTQAARLQRRKGIAHVLRRARGFSLLSQPELAKALGISTRSVAGYEAGETEAPATIVLEWLRICGRPLDDLAGAWADDEDDTPEPRSRCFMETGRSDVETAGLLLATAGA